MHGSPEHFSGIADRPQDSRFANARPADDETEALPQGQMNSRFLFRVQFYSATTLCIIKPSIDAGAVNASDHKVVNLIVGEHRFETLGEVALHHTRARRLPPVSAIYCRPKFLGSYNGALRQCLTAQQLRDLAIQHLLGDPSVLAMQGLVQNGLYSAHQALFVVLSNAEAPSSKVHLTPACERHEQVGIGSKPHGSLGTPQLQDLASQTRVQAELIEPDHDVVAREILAPSRYKDLSPGVAQYLDEGLRIPVSEQPRQFRPEPVRKFRCTSVSDALERRAFR